MKPILYFFLNITIDGAPSTFKCAATDKTQAQAIASDYWPDKRIHVQSIVEGRWTPES